MTMTCRADFEVCLWLCPSIIMQFLAFTKDIETLLLQSSFCEVFVRLAQLNHKEWTVVPRWPVNERLFLLTFRVVQTADTSSSLETTTMTQSGTAATSTAIETTSTVTSAVTAANSAASSTNTAATTEFTSTEASTFQPGICYAKFLVHRVSLWAQLHRRDNTSGGCFVFWVLWFVFRVTGSVSCEWEFSRTGFWVSQVSQQHRFEGVYKFATVTSNDSNSL